MNNLSQEEIDKTFLLRAVQLSKQGVEKKTGRPFGSIVVKDDRIVGEGYNQVPSLIDPTAHAQVMAIRDACKNLGTFNLNQCIIYTSCEPCPMCLGAIYLSNVKRVVFANTKENAADIKFDTTMIYDQIGKDFKSRKINFQHIQLKQALAVFNDWAQDQIKTKKN